MLGLLKINLNTLKSRIYMINKYAEIGVRTSGYTIYQRQNYSSNKIFKTDLVNRKVLESRSKLEVCKVQPYPGCNSKLRLPQNKLPIPQSTLNKSPQSFNQNQKNDRCYEVERKIAPAKPKFSSCPGQSPPPPPEDPPSNMKYYALILALIGGLGGAWAYHNGYFHKKEDKDINIVKTEEACEPNIPVQPCATKGKRFPEASKEIPCNVPYLLIGGGTASFSAFRAIKSHDPTARVLVITDEYEMPYMRPPLSKEIWFNDDEDSIKNLKFKQWNGTERSLYYEPDDFYVKPQELCSAKNGGVAIVRGYKVKKIDAFNQKVILNDGYEITYKQCCLATGSQPKKLVLNEQNTMELENNENVTFFKTINDFEVLKEKLTKNKTIAVIGGGFLGSELSCALAKYGEKRNFKIYQIFYEIGNMGKILPEYLSKWTMNCIKHEGVNIIAKSQIKNITYNKNTKEKQLTIKLFDGKQIFVDHIIVTIGSEPNVNIGKLSNLEVDEKFGGYVVNAELEARRNLYVAGDAACFFDPILGRRRVEHHDHAVVSGRLAGENMVGLKKPYTHQSMFWSDLGPKIGFEAIGLVDSSLTTVGVFAKSTDKDIPAAATNDKLNGTPPEEPTESTTVKDDTPSDTDICKNKNSEIVDDENDDYGKGVIFYLRDNKVVGILLWNVFNRINIARKIISECKEYKDLNEVAKLFKIHE